MASFRIDDVQGLTSGAAAWAKPIAIPTYPAGKPDPNPMFLEKRVYQGSSGSVYPLPFIDSVAKDKIEVTYQALHLENEFVYLMLLPEIGGRIHIGFDKVAGYDFFYRQNVIKPALVGLAGPWISGGVEFNWPQHHRPSTFMPCEWMLEEAADGSRTFWLSEHEPMNRMKGMHGIRLVPGSSLIELRARLYNRTALTQTFLWWANVAARVHEKYQSFFPPDVQFVADHAKRGGSSFPACEDSYYGVPYGERARKGVRSEERPDHFQPAADLPPNRLDWYANIPVPTSYMVVSTGFDFFGGYDHSVEAGFVHVADRRIAPGKKQWTWGNHKFGYAWDDNLTDEGGPYVELMAGVYTDNQPDFSFISPYETKTFSQYWYPIRKIGPPSNASKFAAVSLQGRRVGVQSTSLFKDAVMAIDFGDRTEEITLNLAPDEPWIRQFGCEPLAVRLESSAGELLVQFDPRQMEKRPAPVLAVEPDLPGQIESLSELYAIGVHLEQYRHATRAPEDYWLEGLRRDPSDHRCLLSLGRASLRKGRLAEARSLLERATALLTRFNPNPPDGEAHYTLGVVLTHLREDELALDAFGKASWNYGWKGASLIESSRLHMRSSRFEEALNCLSQAQVTLGDANVIFNLRATIWRTLNEFDLAQSAAQAVLAHDPLDHWARYESFLLSPTEENCSLFKNATRSETQNLLDLAFEYQSCGRQSEAQSVLSLCAKGHPIVSILRGERPLHGALEGMFPSRTEELLALEEAVKRDLSDYVSRSLLGTLYYHHKRYEESILQWEESVRIEPNQAGVWRNLGIAYFNSSLDPARALHAYEEACARGPEDARLLYERDQLQKRLRFAPESRLATLRKSLHLVELRDDLTIEMANLHSVLGDYEAALNLMENRRFAPWEGGEGSAIGAFARACSLKARVLVQEGKVAEAVACLQRGLVPPKNLGEARHLLSNCSDLWVQLAEAQAVDGQASAGREHLLRAAEFKGDFQTMSVRAYSEMTYFSALALKSLGREEESESLLHALEAYAVELESIPAKIDYFATSLPSMLLFNEDLQARQTCQAKLLQAQASLGLGHMTKANELVDQVLTLDPYSIYALDLKSELGAAN